MKGHTNNPNGRPKGKQNKTTTAMKEAFILAFEKRGGIEALMTWADANETEFYRIIGKMIPKELEVSGPEGGPIPMRAEVVFVGKSQDREG